MFTRKHYKAIAAIVKLCSGPDAHYGHQTTHTGDLVAGLATLFAADNSLFDRERFLTACGVEPEPKIDYHECGSCGAYHRADYAGDCRNDSERFSYEDLTQLGVSAELIVGIDADGDWAVTHHGRTGE